MDKMKSVRFAVAFSSCQGNESDAWRCCAEDLSAMAGSRGCAKVTALNLPVLL